VQYRTYAADCRLYIPGHGVNWVIIHSTLLDEFVLAHTLGWWAKALVMRNHLLLWTCSISFELLELTFQVGRHPMR
jgi:phosphatidylserine synthase 2